MHAQTIQFTLGALNFFVFSNRAAKSGKPLPDVDGQDRFLCHGNECHHRGCRTFPRNFSAPGWISAEGDIRGLEALSVAAGPGLQGGAGRAEGSRTCRSVGVSPTMRGLTPRGDATDNVA